jgi:hypothetical protein
MQSKDIHTKDRDEESKPQVDQTTSQSHKMPDIDNQQFEIKVNPSPTKIVKEEKVFSRNLTLKDPATGLNFYETISKPRSLSLDEEEMMVPKIPQPVDYCTITFSDGKTSKLGILESTDGVRFIDIRFFN